MAGGGALRGRQQNEQTGAPCDFEVREDDDGGGSGDGGSECCLRGETPPPPLISALGEQEYGGDKGLRGKQQDERRGAPWAFVVRTTKVGG